MSVPRFSKYVTKPDTWSPEAGLPLDVLEALRVGLHRRRIAIGWGVAWEAARAGYPVWPRRRRGGP
jgi:hypothetical protein